MANFRLELWFDYNASPPTLNWGVAQDAGGDPPFSDGGTAIAKTGDKVVITGAGSNSMLDIYLFDVSGDGVARDLQWIWIDYTRAQGNSGTRNPVAESKPLRRGMTGAAFCGSAGGTTQGVGYEDTIFSAPSGTTAQRRWSAVAGYEGLTPGDYFFKASVVVTPAGGGQAFSVDPEMDIQT
jgi:hypothetical protein